VTDRYGAVTLPAPLGEDPAGDPGLGVLGSFLQSVINARLGAAWAEVMPGKFPVETVIADDPEERNFNEKNLPALYLTRTKGKFEQLADDIRVAEDTIRILWILPPAPQAKARLRNKMMTAAARAADACLRRGRYAGWVHAADLADADAVMTARPTALVAEALGGDDFDGEVGSSPLVTPRKATITASSAVGAYSLSPVYIEGYDADGAVIGESLTPVSADGGWTLEGSLEFSRVLRADVPAQALTTGSWTIGHTADQDADREGSAVLLHAGIAKLVPTSTWEDTKVTIQITDGKPRVYEAMQLMLTAVEHWDADIEDGTAPLEGIDVDILNEDDLLIEQATLE